MAKGKGKKRREEKRRKRGGKTKVGKFLKKAKEKLKKLGSNVALAPVIIFVPLMVAILDKRGIPHTRSIENIVETFYNKVVRKNNFDGGEELNFDSYGGANLIPLAIIGAVVKAIISWIKDLKKRKAEGETLSDEEEQAIENADKAQKQIEDVATDAGEDAISEKIKDFIFSPMGAVTGLALLVVLIMAFKGK